MNHAGRGTEARGGGYHWGMLPRASFALPLLLALPAVARAQEPAPAAPLLGRFEEGRYSSPDGSFRVTFRPGSGESVRVGDRESGAREFVVTLSDRYCRQLLVVETRGELEPEGLAAWVSRQVVGAMNPQAVLGLERRRDTTRFGPTEWLEWTSPRLAPCEEATVVDGRQGKRTRPDAQAAMAVFLRPGRIYRVLYLVGLGAQGAISNGVQRLPAGAVLRQLLEGFEVGDGGGG